MERGVIEAHERHTVRRMRTAMHGSAIRALVELITNADDSYIRLESDGYHPAGKIEIIYKKEGHQGVFAVRDHAEGMSIDDVRQSFKKYGAPTSGMEKGKRVRGYFGQGAKDALASMVNGTICTFKDDQFVECKIFIENDKPMYEISDPIPANPELRNRHSIDGNGTIAYFEADRQRTGPVPQVNTVHEQVANNFLLRKIMISKRRVATLLDQKSGKPRRLRYLMPEGKEILRDDFAITYDDLGAFPIHIAIMRAEKVELTQAGEDREGGLLLLDDEDIVLGISLFKYDNEPLAARFSGEVRIGGFRKLLEREEPVLLEERDGLASRHPFCQMLIPAIEERIEKAVKAERLRKQKEDQSKIDVEEASRYRKAFTILNQIAEFEAQAEIYLGETETDIPEAPPNGFCLYPSSAQITVDKRYRFELRLDTKVVPHGSVIKVTCSHPGIRVLTPNIKLSFEDGSGILSKYISIQGIEPNIQGALRAVAGDNLSEAKIFVVPEKELLLDEGMVFQPETLTIRPNRPRRIYLLVYVKMIEGGSIIKVSSDNESIHVSKNEISVNEADATRHIAKYELEVWGEGAGENGMITAEYEAYIALLEVSVRSLEKEEQKSRKGMFSEPEFSYDIEPLQRSSYSATTGKVMVYVNFPSVRHYLGHDCRYRKTLPAQVLVADLVAERCFREIASKKVELSGATLSPQSVPDRIQRDMNLLSKKYGKKVHQALVDQRLIEDVRSDYQSYVGEQN